MFKSFKFKMADFLFGLITQTHTFLLNRLGGHSQMKDWRQTGHQTSCAQLRIIISLESFQMGCAARTGGVCDAICEILK